MSQAGFWAPRTANGEHRGYALFEAILAGGVGIVAAIGLTLIVSLGLGALGFEFEMVTMVGLIFVMTGIGMIGTGTVYLSIRGVPIREYVGVRVPRLTELLWAAGGYIGALLLILAASRVLTALQAEPDTANQAAELGMENPSLLLWLVPISFLVVAPAEEFLFRGVIQGRLREAFDAKLAIPMTAALFALVHYFSLSGTMGARLIAIAVLFLPSLVFGYVYERTENLVVPILIHGMYNSTLVLLLYVAIKLSGQMPAPA